MTNKKTGIIILSAMGSLWWVMGAITLHHTWRALATAFAVLVLGGLLFATTRQSSALTKLDGKVFGLSVAFEIAGIAAAIWLLSAFHQPTFILPAITIVVGLHFIGMWLATDNGAYIQITVAMCSAGLVSAILPFPARMQAAGLSSAIILWASAALGLSRQSKAD